MRVIEMTGSALSLCISLLLGWLAESVKYYRLSQPLEESKFHWHSIVNTLLTSKRT